MVCPKCGAEFRVTERQGIEIEYCPQCRGIWLDRGELDRIVERAVRERRLTESAGAPAKGAPAHANEAARGEGNRGLLRKLLG